MTTIKEELLAIQAAASDGLLHVEDAEAWARANPNSGLHKSLEWNDVVAAREHRYGQIRRLIKLHVIQVDGAPQLVSLSFDRVRGGGYREIAQVVKTRDLAEIMFEDAVAELERVRKKYEHVSRLFSVWHEIERVVATGRRKQDDKEQRAQAQGNAGRPGRLG